MKKLLVVLALLVLPFQVFAADAVMNRDTNYEVKGWSIFAADDDIDTSAQLVTDLDTTYAQLAAADKIEIVSASAADITQTITVKGIDSNGNQVKEEIALNTTAGTTQVTSDTTFLYIDQIGTDIPCAGVVTVRRGTGDTFINSIPAGGMEGQVVQHFNGEKDSYVTGWWAAVTSTTGTVDYRLYWYPDDSKCLSPTTGFVTLDTITLTNALDESYHPLPSIKCPRGGWLTVLATGGSANSDGAVRIEGYDTAN